MKNRQGTKDVSSTTLSDENSFHNDKKFIALDNSNKNSNTNLESVEDKAINQTASPRADLKTLLINAQINKIHEIITLSKEGLADKHLLRLIKIKDFDLIKTLLINGLDPHYSNNLLMRSALHQLNLQLFHLLINNGFDIKKLEGWLFSYTLQHCSSNSTRFLIEYGLDINKAIEYIDRLINDPNIISTLITFGVNVRKLNLAILNRRLVRCDRNSCLRLLEIIQNLSKTEMSNFFTNNKLINNPQNSLSVNDVLSTLTLFQADAELNYVVHTEIKEFYQLKILQRITNCEQISKINYKTQIFINIQKQIVLGPINFSTLGQEVLIDEAQLCKVFELDNVALFSTVKNRLPNGAFMWPEHHLFILSCVFGADEIFRYMLIQGIKIKNHKCSAIRMSIKFQQPHILKYLLKNSGDILMFKDQLLNVLADNTNNEVIKVIIKRFNLGMSDITKLLQNSCNKKNFIMVNFIINNHYNSIDNNLGSTSIPQTLMRYGKLDMLAKILTFCFHPIKLGGNSAFKKLLFEAASYKKAAPLKFLLKYLHQHYTYSSDELINELLIKASYQNSVPVIKLLLSLGADLHYKEDHPLRNVCFNENILILDYLIKKHINLKSDGEKLLEYCSINNLTRAAEFLLIRGVKGFLALCNLYNRQKLTEAEFLIKHKVNLNEALLLACECNYFLACKHLINVGADISQANHNLLSLSAYNGNFSIVKLLVESGADISSKALLAASTCVEDRIDIINYLLLNSSQTVRLNSDIISAAEKVGNFKIFKFLKSLNISGFN